MWPVEYGGTGWDAVQYYIFKEEGARAWAPEAFNHNIGQIGPVICAFGTPAQKEFFLPKIRNLDIWFCQGFSEPGSGSDLASLKTRAVREGDHYIINGQKMWTTSAHHADWMYGLFRTDVGVKKQAGISYLLVDMRSPGINVRPIVVLDGDPRTNETFFDNVKVPVANLIGEENKGWNYAKYLLSMERAGTARIGLCTAKIGLAKTLAERVYVRGIPLAQDRRFREKLAKIETELKALEITNLLVAASMKKRGGGQDPRTSVLKLKGSELLQATTELLLHIAGPHALPSQYDFLIAATEDAIGPDWAATAAPNYFLDRAISIYGGTNEIQRNIVAKNIMGLQ